MIFQIIFRTYCTLLMSAQKLNYSSFRKCQSETEIRNIFERHMRTLLDFKRKMINEITEWETNLIRQIQQNVINQKNFLENEYKLQLQDLEIKCQEFLDTALIYEEKKNRDEVRRLIEQCHIYKIELGTFEYPEKLIPFIELSKNKQDLSTIPKYNETSTMNNEFDVRTNKTSHSSISSNPAFANANRIK